MSSAPILLRDTDSVTVCGCLGKQWGAREPLLQAGLAMHLVAIGLVALVRVVFVALSQQGFIRLSDQDPLQPGLKWQQFGGGILHQRTSSAASSADMTSICAGQTPDRVAQETLSPQPLRPLWSRRSC